MGDCLLFSSPKAWPYRWRDVVVVVVVVVEVPKALMIRLFQGFCEVKGVTKSL